MLLVQELPGRLWDGKEGLLAALAALCKAAPQAVMSTSQPSASSRAVVDALMTALARKKHAYRQVSHYAVHVFSLCLIEKEGMHKHAAVADDTATMLINACLL